MKHVVRISDGLGNQMFQYAFAYALAKKTGAEVLLDPLFWGTSLRKYQLEEFKIDNTKKLVSDVKDYILGFGPRNGRRFKDKFRQYLLKKNYNIVNEKEIMHFDKTVWTKEMPSFFIGFWQTPLYFDEYYDELKRQFVYKKKLSEKAIKYQNKINTGMSVSLHIRRTDYVRETDNAAIQMEFYKKALEELERQIGKFQLFVFSDDKQFIRDNFCLHEYILIEDIEDLEEFELMRLCNHHIIANSTFSWWAAYLAENKGGIVYAPCTGIWSEDFYPKEWNRILADT